MDVTNPSNFGTLVFGEPEVIELPHPGNPQHTVSTTRERGEWHPPERLAQYLPEDFSIPIDCNTGPDGLRRLIPRCSFEELIDVGVVGGLAVLHGIHGFDPHVDHSYRSMQLIHQYVRGRAHRGKRGMQEHMTRRFASSRDLYVRQTGRLSDDERNVLPDSIGQTPAGEGHRLSVGQLTSLGRDLAVEAGRCRQINEWSISYALFEMARRNLLDVEPDRVLSLVKMALFDLDATQTPPADETLEIVTERLLTAINGHLEDGQEPFENWFTGSGSSLIKQISRGKRKRGGDLAPEDVRQAFLHLGWQAYQYVGQCVHALMRTIKNSLPCPLNDAEKRIFERMYESQACYGDMPFALLAERAGFLQQAVLAIWNEPENDAHVGTLHRMLAYYAEMAPNRREADRRSNAKCSSNPMALARGACSAVQVSKQPAPGHSQSESECLPHDHSPPVSGQLIENLHSVDGGSDDAAIDPFAEVAEHVRELHHIECESRCANWEYRRIGDSEDMLTIGLRCECGQTQQQIELPIEDFADHAQRILEWERVADEQVDDP